MNVGSGAFIGKDLAAQSALMDLENHAVLDKSVLVGGCTRLPLTVDAERLRSEADRLPLTVWGTTGGRMGVHSAAEALFLRGYAPVEGDKPMENRSEAEWLPYTRSIFEELIPAPAMRCLLARLPAGASIAPHVDLAPYFWKTLRLHIPVETHDQVWTVCAGQSYRMKPGEVWALNNNAVHAVWNAHATLSRTHLICDFLPTPALLELIARGERDLGQMVPEVDAHLLTLTQ